MNKTQKGITLIALIITIIVMLILVAVTINVALNGGLFQRAKDASSQMQIEADREELVSAVFGAYNERTDAVDVQKLKQLLENNGWTVNILSTPYLCTSPSQNPFNVDAKGNITIAQNNGGGNNQPNNTAPDDLEKYILGENKQGRALDQIITNGDFNNGFKDDEVLTPNINEAEKIDPVTMIFSEVGDKLVIYFYIKYNDDGNLYRFKIEAPDLDTEQAETTPISEQEGIKVISVSNPDVGKELTLNGVEYIVLYGEGEKTEGAQLITKNAMQNNGNNINLGYDANVFDGITVNPFDGNKTKEDAEPYLEIEKAVLAYNNAVKRLNDICYELIMDEEIEDYVSNIRSVGSNPISNPTQFVTTPVNPFTTEYLANEWPSNDSHYNVGALNGKAECLDENYLEDIDRLYYLEASPATINGTAVQYWLASRHVGQVVSDIRDFDIRYIGDSGTVSMGGHMQWNVSSGSTMVENYALAVRPVVVLNANALGDLLD